MTRRSIFTAAWHQLGRIHLTVILCLLLVVDLVWGYLCLNRHVGLFAPLNDIGLATWLQTYGRHNLIYTFWFFILLGLLALLCINTFVCTTDRVAALLRTRNRLGLQRLIFKLAPHIMHYAVIVILLGYLSSYLFAQVLDTRTLVPGSTLTLPDTTTHITFTAFEPVYYQGSSLPAFENRVMRPRSRLLLTNADHQHIAVLSYNQPLHVNGYGIFLKDFAPKQRNGGMSSQVRIDMIIRKDPGVRFYMAGVVLFTVGLLIYLMEWILYRNAGVRRAEQLSVNNEL